MKTSLLNALLLFLPLMSHAQEQTLQELNEDLKNAYFREAQAILGTCESGDCLKVKEGAKVFEDELGEEHCYPNTNCDFYDCMEKKYQCMDVDVIYFKKLAKPTCEAYVSNIKKGIFSEKGKDWIYRVMVCLQKGLFDECSLKGNCPTSENNEKTCKHITEFTLEFHPGCYINSGVGVCKLPIKDQLNIWKTVGPYLTKRERQEAMKVVRYCAFGIPVNKQ